MQSCHTLTSVSNSIWLNLGTQAYNQIVVKQYNRGDEYFGKDDKFEDSDYEVGLDQSENPVKGAGKSSDGQSEQATLSILTIGSYAR